MPFFLPNTGPPAFFTTSSRPWSAIFARSGERTPLCGSFASCGAAEAAGLQGLHRHRLSAGLPQLADKALRLALCGAPVVIALAVILIDPDHTWEHVHTRFPDGAQEGVMIPARRLHERFKLVPGICSFLDVMCNLSLLRLQECLELLLQLSFVFPQLGVLRFWGVLGKREGAKLGSEGLDLLGGLLLDVPRDLDLIHNGRVRHGGTGELDDGLQAGLTDHQVVL